jgi:hypothetical protein
MIKRAKEMIVGLFRAAFPIKRRERFVCGTPLHASAVQKRREANDLFPDS